MEGYAIKVTFSNGMEGIFESVTMRRGEKILVIKRLEDTDKRVYKTKRDLLNRIRGLRRQFGDIANFDVIPSRGRKVQKLGYS